MSLKQEMEFGYIHCSVRALLSGPDIHIYHNLSVILETKQSFTTNSLRLTHLQC